MNSIALTIDEASEYTGIGRNTLRQLIAWQKIPTLYIGSRNYIILVTADIPEDYFPLDLICTKPDGCYTSSEQVASMCRTVAKKIKGLKGFHFRCLRHLYTTNLLANGAAQMYRNCKYKDKRYNTYLNIFSHFFFCQLHLSYLPFSHISFF